MDTETQNHRDKDRARGLRIVSIPIPAVNRYGPFVGRFFQIAATTDNEAAKHLVDLLERNPARAQDTWKPRFKAGACRVFADGSALIGYSEGGTTTWWPVALDTPDSVLTVPMYAGKGRSLELAPNPKDGTIHPKGVSAAATAWPKAFEEVLGAWLDAAGPVPALDDPRTQSGGTFSVYSPFPSLTEQEQAFLDTLLDHLSVLVGAPKRLRVIPTLLSSNGQQGQAYATLRGVVSDKERTGALFRAVLHHPNWPIPATHGVARSFNDIGPGPHPVATSAHARMAAHRWFATHFPDIPTTEVTP
jgi:hypothetical protein